MIKELKQYLDNKIAGTKVEFTVKEAMDLRQALEMLEDKKAEKPKRPSKK